MKILLRPAILATLILAVMLQGCGEDEPEDVVVVDVVQDKAVSRTKLLARTEAPGVIKIKKEKWQDVIVVSGPGSFISAFVSKKGGDSKDLSKPTLVRLRIDRDIQVSLQSFEVTRAMGLSGQNYSGIAWFKGQDNVETLALGYSQPIYFSSVLKLAVKVDDPGVEKVLVSATINRKDTGKDEGTGPGDSQNPFP